MNLSKVVGFRILLAVIYLRLRLLLRQKLGWISLGVGFLLVLLSMAVARVSFISPEKIFWDFSLSVNFVMQVSLAVYLGSQIFTNEKDRRTLHLLLSAGVSRGTWLVGNALGIWLGLTAMNIFWFILGVLTSALQFPEGMGITMQIQAQILLSAEVLIVLFFSLFFSLLLRPLLALSTSAVLCLLLHSIDNLARVFTDKQVGRFIDERGFNLVIAGAKFFPPLHWLDVKPLVGYTEGLDALVVLGLLGISLLWAAFFAAASWLRFEKMDI